jgi:hypothetical protein
MKSNKLKNGMTYDILFDGDGYPNYSYAGKGIFKGEIKDIGGPCGLFEVFLQDEKRHEFCYFPLESVKYAIPYNNDIVEPLFDERGVGFCSEECPSYDGKRCKILGFVPGIICEPWIWELLAERERNENCTV